MEEKNLNWRKPVIVTEVSLEHYMKNYPTRKYKLVGSDFLGFLKQEIEHEEDTFYSIKVDKHEFPIIENRLLEFKATHGLGLKRVKEMEADIILKNNESNLTTHTKTSNKISLYKITPIKEFGSDIPISIYKRSDGEYVYRLNCELLKFSACSYSNENLEEVCSSIKERLKDYPIKMNNLMISLETISKNFNNELMLEENELSKIEKGLYEEGYDVCKKE